MGVVSLGVDIGGSSVKAAVLRDGVVVGEGVSSGYARPDAGVVRDAIGEAVRACGGATALEAAQVGLCLPGRFDPQRRCVVRSVNAPGLEGVPVDGLLAGVSTSERGAVVVGDAHAATHDVVVGRGWSGRTLGVAMGTGVGACVLDGVALLRVGAGSGGGSGHFGQMDVGVLDASGAAAVGPDGGRGSLEAYVGLAALRARFGDGLAGAIEGLGADDPAVVALARAIRIGHAIYRPDRVVLLGGVGLAFGRCGVLEGVIRDGLTSVARGDWVLACGDSRHHAARGAARLAMDGV